ncbi:MAG: CAP domain-containing protein [Paracoccaceae bacterium]
MRSLKTLCTIAILAITGCSEPSVTSPSTAAPANYSFEAGNFQTLINNARTSRGLGAIQPSAKLTATAQGHANDMSANGFFSHTSSNGYSVGRRAKAQGYGFCWIAENISVGRTSEAEVFARWMGSPGHRKNMLARDPTEYGLAVAPGNYRVLVLGTPGC